MVLNQLLPSNVRTAILTQIDRITQPVADFIRGNPLVSTAIVGIGTTGLVAGATTLIRRKKAKKKTAKKRKRKTSKRTKKACKRKSKKKPKRKFGLRKAVRSKKIKTTKNGQPYIILANGRARFIKKKSARIARKRKGGFK